MGGDAQVYVVVFSSRVRDDVDGDELRRLDEAAYEEARVSGGLYCYVPGSDVGSRASVCVWESAEHARRASRLPAHQEAASRWEEFYSWYEVMSYANEGCTRERRVAAVSESARCTGDETFHGSSAR
jgi:hypothetical protein